jgi:hypothetical protein
MLEGPRQAALCSDGGRSTAGQGHSNSETRDGRAALLPTPGGKFVYGRGFRGYRGEHRRRCIRHRGRAVRRRDVLGGSDPLGGIYLLGGSGRAADHERANSLGRQRGSARQGSELK